MTGHPCQDEGLGCLRRAKPKQIGRASAPAQKGSANLKRTKNIRAIQLLLGHSKLKSTVRYLGSERTTPQHLARLRKGPNRPLAACGVLLL